MSQTSSNFAFDLGQHVSVVMLDGRSVGCGTVVGRTDYWNAPATYTVLCGLGNSETARNFGAKVLEFSAENIKAMVSK